MRRRIFLSDFIYGYFARIETFAENLRERVISHYPEKNYIIIFQLDVVYHVLRVAERKQEHFAMQMGSILPRSGGDTFPIKIK